MPGVVVPSWDMGQVIGTWRKHDGTLRPGKFKVTYPRVTNVTDDAIIPAGVFAEGDLNVQPGARSLDIALPATDDPDNAEDAFTITIVITFTDAAAETYNVAIPVGGTVNLRTIIPAVSSIPVQQPHLKMGVPGGLAVLDALGRVLDGDGDPIVGGGAGVDWDTLAGKPPVIAAGASDAEAREAIGAGTSNLTLGASSSTAKAGDWTPAWADVSGKPATFAPTIGATATTAVAGNDPRLSDARTPLTHTHDDRYFTEAESDGRFVRTVNGTGPDGSGNVTVAGGGGVTDHGALTGLGDDDHAIYALADGTRGTFAAPLGADDNYVTDAEKAALHAHANKVALDNVSGVNTGDQTLPTWSTIAGKPAVVAAGATQADARTAIGAGTSNLAIGTTGTTAAAGNRAATETATGMVELATTVEATTGTDTTRAVTPAGLKAVADTKAATSHTHDWDAMPAGSVCAIVQTTAGEWPAAPSARTDLVYDWISLPGDTTAPPGVAGAVNRYDARV